MKTKNHTGKVPTGIKKATNMLLTSGILLTAGIQESKGQWGIVIPNGGRTLSPIAKIGVGFFPTAPSIQSKLHVNQFLLASNPATDGFLFRTDGNSAQNSMWQLYTGTSATAQTEKFRIMIPANSNDVLIRATQAGATMQFQTTGPFIGGGVPITRMTITDGLLNGFVGIGENFVTPQSRVHQHELVPVDNFHQFTNSGTGNTATDGLKIGIDAAGNATYNQFENLPHIWKIGNPPAEWMRIQHGNVFNNFAATVTNGYVGLNQPNPFFHLMITTPAVGGGELMLGAQPSDVANSQMGLANATSVGSRFLPTFFGRIDNTQPGPAIQTLGSIDNSQDLAPGVNNLPVHRFVVGKNWNFNMGSIQNLDTIKNRVAFTWQNANVIKMMMNADGQVRIGASLLIPATLPNNRVEITASVNDPYNSVIPVNGASGLRFTHLTSLKTPLNNGVNGIDTTKVLSVDQNGDVVLVRAGGGGNADNGLSLSGPTSNQIHLGQSIGATGNPARLLDDREIPMNNYNLIFRDPPAPLTPTKNRIELGNVGPIANIFNAKFSINNIDNTTFRIGGYFTTVYNVFPYTNLPTNPFYFGTSLMGTKKIGIVGIGVDSTSVSGKAIGISGFGYTASNSQGNMAIGVSGKAYSNNGTFNTFGVYGYVDGNGVISHAAFFSNNSVSNINFGIEANIPVNNTSVVNYAVYALAPPPTSGTFPPNNNYAGFFNGGVYNAINIVPSDQIMKKNIQPVNSVLNKLSNLNPIYFEFDTSLVSSHHLSLPIGKQYGLTAQNISSVFPELIQIVHKPEEYDTLGNVSVPSIDFKGVNYIGFVPILIQAIKEQQSLIDSLINKDSINNAKINQLMSAITTLSNTISSCCSNNNSKIINNTNITLSSSDAIVLNQNAPNPFAERTVITYYIPEKYSSAQIIFTTMNGQILKTIDVSNKKSHGQITVYADDLSSGMYIYYLVVDGKTIETKRMEKQ